MTFESEDLMAWMLPKNDNGVTNTVTNKVKSRIRRPEKMLLYNENFVQYLFHMISDAAGASLFFH